MTLIRFGMVLAILFCWAGSGTAQESKARKVYTNEDVQRPSDTPVGATEKSPEPAPDATVQQTQTTPPNESPSEGPGAELQKALELQKVLRQNLEEYQNKIANETDPGRKSRWTSMAECLSTLLQYHQQTIDEINAEVQRNSQQAGAPPAS